MVMAVKRRAERARAGAADDRREMDVIRPRAVSALGLVGNGWCWLWVFGWLTGLGSRGARPEQGSVPVGYGAGCWFSGQWQNGAGLGAGHLAKKWETIIGGEVGGLVLVQFLDSRWATCYISGVDAIRETHQGHS